MNTRFILITFFVLINALMGRIFQNAIGSLCMTELVIFAVNTNYIDCISKNKNGDGILFLNTGAQLKFSRTYQHMIPQ